MKYGIGTYDIQRNGRVRVRIPDGKGKYKPGGTYDTEEEAKRVLAALAEERGKRPEGASTIGTFGELAIQRFRLAGKSSWETDIGRWKIVTEHAEWAQYAPDAVGKGEIKDFLVDLLHIDSKKNEPYSAQTVKHVLNLSRTIFADALDKNLVEVNPCVGLKPPGSIEQNNWTALSTDELRMLARANCHTRFADDYTPVPWVEAVEDLLTFEQTTVFLLCAYSGLRKGECAALEWEHVLDLDGAHPHLWICRSWDKPYTKDREPRRVDLIPAAVELLQSWRQHQRGSVSKYVWGQLYAYGYDWGWARTIDLKRGVCWLGARQKLGIARRVTFHHLRDTCASHLLTGSFGYKWTIAEVAQLLGHSTTHVTERYARLLPGANAAVAAQTYRAAAEQPAANLPRAKTRGGVQVPEIIGRAIPGSNGGQPAPEAEASGVISTSYPASGRSAAGSGAARQVPRQVAHGGQVRSLELERHRRQLANARAAKRGKR